MPQNLIQLEEHLKVGRIQVCIEHSFISILSDRDQILVGTFIIHILLDLFMIL